MWVGDLSVSASTLSVRYDAHPMASVCLYLQLHQPFRLRRYSVFDSDHHYFDDLRNAEICRKVTHRSYLPAGRVLLRLLKDHGGSFKVALSFTGTVLDQFEAFAPEVLDLFQQIVATGHVEVLSETSHHSLAFIYSREEFRQQVELHRRRVEGLFGQTPRSFRNTELLYNNDLAAFVSKMGYEVLLAEGADRVLAGRSPGQLFHPAEVQQLRVLLRNYRLSDDIAYRFSNRSWESYPLTAEKFAGMVDALDAPFDGTDSPRLCNLFMDFETFGEHQWAETGILDFLQHLPERVLSTGRGHRFITPSSVAEMPPREAIDVPHMTSWADSERDVSAWLGNAMQSNAMHELYKLEAPVKEGGDPQILEAWRRLTTSDHCYYMSTKFWSDGEVHSYFNPYESPYDAYINFMNVLDNIASRVGASGRRG
jgi:alpha-amylase